MANHRNFLYLRSMDSNSEDYTGSIFERLMPILDDYRLVQEKTEQLRSRRGNLNYKAGHQDLAKFRKLMTPTRWRVQILAPVVS